MACLRELRPTLSRSQVAIADCGFGGVGPKYDPADTLEKIGPTIGIDVSHPPDQAGVPVTGKPTVTQVPALVDTGAGDSCIDEQLAIDLGFPLVDKQQGAGVSGADEFNIYLAHVAIPALGISKYGSFLGARLSKGGQKHRALLGRDLLKSAILIYDGPAGTVRLVR